MEEQQTPNLLTPVTEEMEKEPTPINLPQAHRVSSSCWTEWFDRDDPSGTGDWETLFHLHMANPGKICPNPLAIQVQTLTGLTVAQTGDVIYR
ncbi:cartilage intermediate layer protein 1-like [Anarrhichthys ocellatus]|uniref:cartilage intermediate layer protein 1-like n=1 Tax=Anarrhichthys ocellatus TaxID=433405 RepID=UPI0012EEB682|nr:cartilage intermediate layer protein 1-like [Anarrhichthys ocellatus]